jgi:hypothetical protein
MLYVLFVVLAGCGAGAITGLIGASAVAVAVPILVVFAGYDPYEAIAIALAIDIIVSIVAAYTYSNHSRVDLRAGAVIASASVAGAILGSWASSFLSATTLGGGSGLITLGIGLTFFARPGIMDGRLLRNVPYIDRLREQKTVLMIAAGLVIGIICGVIGAGGGLVILLCLVVLLEYPIHMAIGTSVLIMIFTAGAATVGHGMYGALDVPAALLGAAAGAGAAVAASRFANAAPERVLKRIVGVVYIAFGLLLAVAKLCFPGHTGFT